MAQTIVAVNASMEISEDDMKWETIAHTGTMDMSFSAGSADGRAMGLITAEFEALLLIIQVGMDESTPEYTDEVG